MELSISGLFCCIHFAVIYLGNVYIDFPTQIYGLNSRLGSLDLSTLADNSEFKTVEEQYETSSLSFPISYDISQIIKKREP